MGSNSQFVCDALPNAGAVYGIQTLVGVGTMRSIRAVLLAVVTVAVGSACGAPASEGPDRPVLPTLVTKAITCQAAFEGFQADDERLREQAEFDSLAACQTREQWIDVGADVLNDTQESLGARLEKLCDGELRHAETPVCRNPS